MKRLLLIIPFLLLAACGAPSEDGSMWMVKTADPNVSIGFDLIQPTAVPEAEPEALIKGNISSSGEKIYHVPGGASYAATQIDEAAGEQWFVTEEEAVAAGWRKAQR